MSQTIRNQKALRQIVDHKTPDDRLRHSAGMGLGEPERKPSVIWPALLLFALLTAYAAPDFIAWARGDVPVMAGRVK